MASRSAESGKPRPLSSSQSPANIAQLIASVFPEDLIAAATHAALDENQALALLRRNDLPAAALEALSRNPLATKSRPISIKLAQQAHTPRHVALPLLRRLFAFELMEVALSPAVATDLKLVAEQLLIDKLEAVSLGERINLARRSSTGVAAALLLQKERSVIEAALQNPRMTEPSVAKALATAEKPGALIEILVDHAKWSLRREVQLAILRRPEASKLIVTKIAQRLPRRAIYELMKELRLPERKAELQQFLLES